MITETKDSVANLTTIAGTGAMVIGWNEIMTMLLVGTGIVLNIIRIIEIRRKKKED
tara:strand:+ start:331 stop:498 length:168 start_codon:yes stop_codon:yes gene_type:complete